MLSNFNSSKQLKYIKAVFDVELHTTYDRKFPLSICAWYLQNSEPEVTSTWCGR